MKRFAHNVEKGFVVLRFPQNAKKTSVSAKSTLKHTLVKLKDIIILVMKQFVWIAIKMNKKKKQTLLE